MGFSHLLSKLLAHPFCYLYDWVVECKVTVDKEEVKDTKRVIKLAENNSYLFIYLTLMVEFAGYTQ